MLRGLKVGALLKIAALVAIMFSEFAYAAPKGSFLKTGEFLGVGDYLTSSNGQYFAIMQGDGNLVVYRGSVPGNSQGAAWSSIQVGHYTGSQGSYFAIMQGDGNLVVYRGSIPGNSQGAVWNSAQDGSYPTSQGSYFAIMQGDGNLVVYQGSVPGNSQRVVWSSLQSASRLAGAGREGGGSQLKTQPGQGPYVGPPGFERNFYTTKHCGSNPESWVRGSAEINTDSGVISSTMQLETDSTSAGPKGTMVVFARDAQNQELARVYIPQQGIGGKPPGHAIQINFTATSTIPPAVAAKVTSIDAQVDCTGSQGGLWAGGGTGVAIGDIAAALTAVGQAIAAAGG